MKKNLFKKSKKKGSDTISISPDGIKTPRFKITKDGFNFTATINNMTRKAARLFLVVVAIFGVSVGLLMAVNNFFNNYYFEFRTPIIFQNPALLHDRNDEMLSPLPEEVTLEVEAKEVEPTPTPEPEVVLSAKAEGCITNYPEVAEKLVDAFPKEPAAAIELVCRESSLNPQAVNPSSGAAGLFQAYPSSKLGCELSDVDCQVAWGKEYISNRYGTVEAALLFHDANNWY